jgi:DUF177 domain-containing protein
MEIHVSQIDEYDGLVVDYTYPDGEPSLQDGEVKPEEGEENEGQIVGPTQVKVRASREGEEVLLRGQIQTAVQFACDRCLTLFRTPITRDFDLLYVSTSKSRNAHEEHELKEDDLSLSYYEGHVINLDDLVREQIELTLPMTHICSEACRGLCSQCGANLNEGECACGAQPTDSRWDALKGLKLNQ